jgi:prophage regulatory protein
LDIQAKRFLRRGQVQAKLGISKTTLYNLERAGQFPAHFNITPRCAVWDEAAVDAWMQQRTGVSAPAAPSGCGSMPPAAASARGRLRLERAWPEELGPAHYRAKLSTQQVDAIRDAYERREGSYRRLGLRFCVSWQTCAASAPTVGDARVETIKQKPRRSGVFLASKAFSLRALASTFSGEKFVYEIELRLSFHIFFNLS